MDCTMFSSCMYSGPKSSSSGYGDKLNHGGVLNKNEVWLKRDFLLSLCFCAEDAFCVSALRSCQQVIIISM